MSDYNNKSGASGILIIMLIGLTVAGIIFLVSFITTQKAATPHRFSNVKLVVPSLPPKQTLPIRIRATLPPLPSNKLSVPVLQDEVELAPVSTPSSSFVPVQP